MKPLAVRYTYTCSACCEQHTDSFGLANDELPRMPCPPPGWRFLGGMYFCNRHQIAITVTTAGELSWVFELPVPASR